MKSILLLCALGFISTLEIIPENVVTEYYNKKYLNSFKFSYKRLSRNTPYQIDMYIDAKSGYGNNLTMNWIILERLSGRYVYSPFKVEYKLCDFLYKDPYIGQMYAKQLTKPWSCPFSAGSHNFTNLVPHLDKFPNVPFTYSSLIVHACVDFQLIFSATNEEVVRLKVYVQMSQKIENPKSNKNNKK